MENKIKITVVMSSQGNQIWNITGVFDRDDEYIGECFIEDCDPDTPLKSSNDNSVMPVSGDVGYLDNHRKVMII